MAVFCLFSGILVFGRQFFIGAYSYKTVLNTIGVSSFFICLLWGLSFLAE